MKLMEGFRVIDLSTFVAAPTAARILGDWGADVIKIENFRGDPLRGTAGYSLNCPPDLLRPDQDFAYDLTGANKRFLSLDIKKPEGHSVLFKLLETADVLITNYRNQALKALGLTYDELKEKFPRLIFAHIVGYGEKGPDKDRPGFDYTAFGAKSGITGSFAQIDSDPINMFNSMGDVTSGLDLVTGICAALASRAKTGKGRKVTVALYAAGMYTASYAIAGAQFGEKFPRSRKTDNFPLLNIYKASDGKWLQLCVADYNLYFNKLVTALGLPELVDHPIYSKVDTLVKHQAKAEVIACFDKAFAKKTAAEWMAIMKEYDLTLEICYTFADVSKDEQAWANGFLSKVIYPSGAEAAYVTAPIHFSDESAPEFRISRPCGADNEEILREAGYSAEEIESLRDRHVINH